MKEETLRKNDLVRLLVNRATQFQRLKIALGGVVKLGQFWPAGYIGLTTFYLFKCRDCRQLSADHYHGYRSDIFTGMWLECHLCND